LLSLVTLRLLLGLVGLTMKIKDVANDIVNYASVNGFSGLSLRYTEERLKELVMHWSPANDPVPQQPELPLEEPKPTIKPKKG
jgi:hypothetical protein